MDLGGINLNSAVETAARERKEHKGNILDNAVGGLMLHLSGEHRNVLRVVWQNDGWQNHAEGRFQENNSALNDSANIVRGWVLNR